MRRLCLGLSVVLVAGAAIGAGDDAARSQPEPAVTQEGQVDCGASGVDVTIALDYNRDSLGEVAGTYLDLDFSEPLEFPKEPNAAEVQRRLTSLMPPEYNLTARTPTEGRKVRLSYTTTEPGIPPKDAFKLRFDCPVGSRVRPSDVICKVEQAADGGGLPMPETLARQVRCKVVRVEPLKATTATSQH